MPSTRTPAAGTAVVAHESSNGTARPANAPITAASPVPTATPPTSTNAACASESFSTQPFEPPRALSTAMSRVRCTVQMDRNAITTSAEMPYRKPCMVIREPFSDR